MKLNKFKEFFLKRKLSFYNIKNYKINDDGSVDVDGDVRIIGTNLDKLPIKFGRVTGYFLCFNLGLKTLEGSPYYVGDSFDCSSNKLVNLKYSPVEVVKHFDCSNNNLKSLEGLSSEIGGNLYCPFNNLKELDSVSNIEGEIHCDSFTNVLKFSGYCKKIDNHYINKHYIGTGIGLNESDRFRSIEKKLKEYGIENYTINTDRTKNELFYYDGGPRYGSAKDPSIPKYYDLAKERYFYSEIDKRYYDDYEIQEFERLYYNKFQKKVKIKNEGDLDSIISKLNTI